MTKAPMCAMSNKEQHLVPIITRRKMKAMATSQKQLLVCIAAIVLSCVRVSSLSISPDTALGKKSTASDVLKVLENTKRLAPYLASPSAAGSSSEDDTTIEKTSSRGIAVVTGANSGIGVTSVETLAAAGMKVILCARNTEGAEKVRESLPAWCRSCCSVQKLDLSDLESIRGAAEEIRSAIGTDRKIDVLLNNAGVMATPQRMETKQGFELQFGTNHVGHHMLTRLLLPGMNHDDGRIVTVASTAHTMGQLDFSDLNYDNGDRPYTPWGAYGQSKLANILFAKGLSDELKSEGSNIKSVSLHPGVIGTNLWRYTPRWTRPFLNLFLTDKNVEQGAATNVYCAIVEQDEFEGGEYCMDCAVAEPNQYGKDETKLLRTQLWKATESLIGEAGYQLPESILG